MSRPVTLARAAVAAFTIGSALVAPLTTPLAAQSVTAPRLRTDARPAGDARPREEAGVVATTATLTVPSEPRTMRVIAVPVPDEMPHGRPLAYVVEPSGDAQVIGTLRGGLPEGAARPSAIHFTVSVPARARSGAMPVARVRFQLAGGLAIETPVQLFVGARRRLDLRIEDALVTAHAGEQVAIRYVLTNLGNGADSVEVRLQPDSPLRTRAGDAARRAIGVRESVADVATVVLPPGMITGRFVVRLAVVGRDGGVMAAGQSTVEVLPSTAAQRAGGPLLTVQSSTVTGPLTGAATAVQATLDGPLAGDVRLTARASTMPSVGAAAGYGLTRGGAGPTPLQVTLDAPRWTLGAGAVGASTSDLTGLGMGGRGASFGLRLPAWSVDAIAAAPQTGAGAGSLGSAAVYSGRVGRRFDGVEVFAAGAHLADGTVGARALDVLSTGADARLGVLGAFTGEVAQRRYVGGSGLGWAAGLRKQARAGSFDVRLTHAPGGSAAFARARDEYNASASRSLGDAVRVSAAAWGSADEAAQGRIGTVSRGASAAVQLQPGEAVRVSLDGRDASYASTTAFGRFGSAERSVGASLSVTAGAMRATLGGGGGVVERETAAAGGVAYLDRGTQAQARGAVALTGAAGMLEVSGSATRSGLVGFLSQQGEFGVRAENVPLVSTRLVQLEGRASLQHLTWFGARTAMDTYGAGVALRLPHDFRVAVDGERNPFFAPSGSGNGRWFMNVRLERALRLPSLFQPQLRGFVYQDLNANGRRDAGEAGLAGIVVRHEGMAIVTGRDGGFSAPRRSSDDVRVDALSIPAGWVATSERAPASSPSFALVPVAGVRVALRVAADDSARVSAAALEQVAVYARAADGRTWLGSRGGDGEIVFDALPPGPYTLDLDVSDVREPLRVAGGAREFVVQVGTPQRLAVTLRPRPLRVRALDAGPVAIESTERGPRR